MQAQLGALTAQLGAAQAAVAQANQERDAALARVSNA
jgi:hypothetical protein